MSLVYITTHNENIYDCAEKEPEKVVNREKYISIHKNRLKSEQKMDIHCIKEPNIKIISPKASFSSHKTMGYPETPLNNPSEYLRKNTGIKFAKIPAHVCNEEKPPLPPVPKRYEHGKFKREPKDFKNMNIHVVRVSIPKKPIAKSVCTKDGLTYILYTSGLTPHYIQSKKYGKVPNYISEMKKCIEKCYRDKTENEIKPEDSLPKGVRLLTSNEIREIFLGLKKNWMDLTQKFNALSVLIDTIPKKNRKHNMEQKLREIEKDIVLFEKNPTIYVYEEDYRQF